MMLELSFTIVIVSCKIFEHFALQMDPVLGFIQPGPNVIKLFTSVIYEFSEQARVFVSCMPLWPSLMFVGKARSLPK